MPGWVKIQVDSDDGYVSSDYVDISYELKKGVTIEEVQTGETGRRANMVSFARRYLGGRYVWGGTSLGSGVDCSGFTQAIYRNFGYSIPRTSGSQAAVEEELVHLRQGLETYSFMVREAVSIM